MTINSILMNAILSMDSYNRGYDAGITLTGTSIGNASLSIDSSELGTVNPDGIGGDRDENIGFFAQAYDYNGETIISYRGTDQLPEDLLLDPENNPDDRDVSYGWTLGAGLTT